MYDGCWFSGNNLLGIFDTISSEREFEESREGIGNRGVFLVNCTP